MEMDALISQVIQASAFNGGLTLFQSTVWLVCATWFVSADGITSVNQSNQSISSRKTGGYAMNHQLYIKILIIIYINFNL